MLEGTVFSYDVVVDKQASVDGLFGFKKLAKEYVDGAYKFNLSIINSYDCPWE